MSTILGRKGAALLRELTSSHTMSVRRKPAARTPTLPAAARLKKLLQLRQVTRSPKKKTRHVRAPQARRDRHRTCRLLLVGKDFYNFGT